MAWKLDNDRPIYAQIVREDQTQDHIRLLSAGQ